MKPKSKLKKQSATSVHKTEQPVLRRSSRKARKRAESRCRDADTENQSATQITRVNDGDADNTLNKDDVSSGGSCSGSSDDVTNGSKNELDIDTPTSTGPPANSTESRPLDDVERSLDELIHDALSSVQPQGTSSPIRDTKNTQQNDVIKQLNLDISKKNVEVEHVQDQNTRLQTQIDLLQDELCNYKKTITNLKRENKKLTTSNDNLRRDLSKHEGIRKFTEPKSTNPGADNQTVSSKEPLSDNMKISDKIGSLDTKLEKLTEQVASFANNVVTALECSRDFKTVVHRKSRRMPAQNDSVIEIKDTPKSPKHQNVSKPTAEKKPEEEVQSIPVRTSSMDRSYSDVTAGRRDTTNQVLIIGTSITRGVGRALHDEGVRADNYTYPGAQIPRIRNRLPHIVNKSQADPATIVIQAGGNDCSSKPLDKVIEEYQCLVNDVKYQWPNSKVILSRIPPRKGSIKNKLKIAGLNAKIESMSDPSLNLHYVDVTPKLDVFYDKGRIHFNEAGVKHYANKLASELTNFHRVHNNPSP